MNPDYPKSFRWREELFKQEDAGSGCVVRYRSGRYELWKWNETQWGAKVDGYAYSVTDDPHSALIMAIWKAIEGHKYSCDVLENVIEQDYFSGAREDFDLLA